MGLSVTNECRGQESRELKPDVVVTVVVVTVVVVVPSLLCWIFRLDDLQQQSDAHRQSLLRPPSSEG
jgi:hypothetical protein